MKLSIIALSAMISYCNSGLAQDDKIIIAKEKEAPTDNLKPAKKRKFRLVFDLNVSPPADSSATNLSPAKTRTWDCQGCGLGLRVIQN